MEAETTANLIALGALVVSLGVAVRGEIVRNGAAGDIKRASDAADRSVAAAERSAAAQERMAQQWADDMSRQEKMDHRQWSTPVNALPDHRIGRGPWAGPAPMGPTQPVVHWTVDRLHTATGPGRRHQLKNLGRAAAYRVELTSDNAVRFIAPAVQDMQMGGAVEFTAIGSMQTGTPELLVTWSDTPDGERKEWRRPLP